MRLVLGVNHVLTQEWLISQGADLTNLKAFDILFSIDSAVSWQLLYKEV